MEIQVKFIKSKNIRINLLTFNKKKIVYLYKNAEFIRIVVFETNALFDEIKVFVFVRA
jgi:hypothetical protein